MNLLDALKFSAFLNVENLRTYLLNFKDSLMEWFLILYLIDQDSLINSKFFILCLIDLYLLAI